MTPALARRLDPRIQKLVSAIVRIDDLRRVGRDQHVVTQPVGTGFWVQRSGSEALVLTAAHVFDGTGGTGGETQIVFANRQRASARAVVAYSKDLDYALLAVPVSSHSAKVVPAALTHEPVKAGDAILQVSATGQLEDLLWGSAKDVRRRIALNARNRSVLENSLSGDSPARTLATGHIQRRRRLQSTYRKNHHAAIETSIRSVPGNSGSPIADRRTGRVIGLLWGALGSPEASVGHAFLVPEILRDVRKQLQAGRIPTAHREAVRRLLGGL